MCFGRVKRELKLRVGLGSDSDEGILGRMQQDNGVLQVRNRRLSLMKKEMGNFCGFE